MWKNRYVERVPAGRLSLREISGLEPSENASRAMAATGVSSGGEGAAMNVASETSIDGCLESFDTLENPHKALVDKTAKSTQLIQSSLLCPPLSPMSGAALPFIFAEPLSISVQPSARELEPRGNAHRTSRRNPVRATSAHYQPRSCLICALPHIETIERFQAKALWVLPGRSRSGHPTAFSVVLQ